MQNRSPDTARSVDSALLLVTVLWQEGPLRVTDAAERLGVSASTAHRLLNALVYRGFAEQLPDRRYGPGELLRGSATPRDAVARLREAALPHMRRLVDEVGETVNLTVLIDDVASFVASVECSQVLRVGDRTGRRLPAHLSSGGKAALALLDPAELAAASAALDEDTAERLRRELRGTRRRGYAINDQQTETGLTAVGVALPRIPGMPLAAIALAMPTARFSRSRLPGWAGDLTAAAGAIARDLSA